MKPLIGHQQQRQSLADLAREERLPSSLLFSGTAGIGKQRAARELARQLLCQGHSPAPQGGCGECKTCHLFDAGNHPDLHTLQFGPDGASVDDLRHTLERMSLRAFMGTRKVAILNDADDISLVGANIILKTLEEPRPENFFILVASTPSRLPQTLLSRCQRWFFDKLSIAEITTILRDNNAAEEDLRLASLADGSMSELESCKLRADVIDELHSALDAAWRGDTARVARAAQEWGGDKTGMRQRLALLRSGIRERLLATATDTAAAAVWAHALQNALDAEYTILERHNNATLILSRVLESCNHALASTYQLTPHAAPPILEELTS